MKDPLMSAQDTRPNKLNKEKEAKLPKCPSCGKIPLICTCKDFEDLKK